MIFVAFVASASATFGSLLGGGGGSSGGSSSPKIVCAHLIQATAQLSAVV